jgi:hypothetical protein
MLCPAGHPHRSEVQTAACTAAGQIEQKPGLVQQHLQVHSETLVVHR